jgi:POT family proton-dependent oligopeptide transporter
MCTYLGAVSLGNVFTAVVNFLIPRWLGTTKLNANYFFFFVIVMVVASLLFVFFARFYQGRTYIQDEAQSA